MKTIFLFLLIIALLSLVSSIWINHYERVRETNRKLRVENEWLIEDRAQALKRASQAYKEKQFWINETMRLRNKK